MILKGEESMKKLRVIEYRAAKDFDYDCYTLSNGQRVYLWLKKPFYNSNYALVSVVDKQGNELGIINIEKYFDKVVMNFNGRVADVKITLKQYLRPNKKYYFDKIIKSYFLNNS